MHSCQRAITRAKVCLDLFNPRLTVQACPMQCCFGMSSSANASTRVDKTNPTTTVEAATLKPSVPFNRWTPRAQPARPVVAVIKTIDEYDKENGDFENEESHSSNANQNQHGEYFPVCGSCDDSSMSVMTASEKLLKTCYRHLTKNYCGVPNCEYSHDPGIIAAARDKSIADLTNAKRELQLKHQGTMKTFEQQGSKSFKQNGHSVERRPQNP